MPGAEITEVKKTTVHVLRNLPSVQTTIPKCDKCCGEKGAKSCGNADVNHSVSKKSRKFLRKVLVVLNFET
jgi:hypothetical protein